MSTVINAAFTTIRAAQQLGREGLRRKPTLVEKVDFGNGVQGNVYEIESIVPSPFCSPWRHPIAWWKLRKLRADIRLLEAEVDPALSKRMRELEAEAFLRGTEAL